MKEKDLNIFVYDTICVSDTFGDIESPLKTIIQTYTVYVDIENQNSGFILHINGPPYIINSILPLFPPLKVFINA